MLSLLLGLPDAACERAQGFVVPPDPAKALGEFSEEPGRCNPATDPSQVGQTLLHLRDARLALARFDPREPLHPPSQSQPERKSVLLGET